MTSLQCPLTDRLDSLVSKCFNLMSKVRQDHMGIIKSSVGEVQVFFTDFVVIQSTTAFG